MPGKHKILIIDDEQINLDFFDVMLSRLGFQVALASHGDEGLEKVRSFSPDLIILDNIMPQLTGWELTRILKTQEEYKEYRDIPIIMFSAMDAVKDKIEGFDLGIEDYITKPFNFSEVLARIRAVLRSRDLAQQVLQRERRIAVSESLTKSLMYFTEHLKSPVEELLKSARALDTSHEAQVSRFKGMVETECDQVLAALGGLQDKIEEMKTEDSRIREAEISLDDLESRYQENFKKWQASSPQQ